MPPQVVVSQLVDTLRLSIEEDLRIGVRDSSSVYYFRHALGVRAAENGHIAVIDETSLRVFSANGVHVWSVANHGAARHFAVMQGICVARDTIVIADSRGPERRFHLFNLTGDSIGFFSRRFGAGDQLSCLGATSAGWTALRTRVEPAVASGNTIQHRSQTVLKLLFDDGDRLVGEALTPESERIPEVSVETRTTGLLRPFLAHTPSFAVSVAGVFASKGDDFAIDVRDPQGHLVRSISAKPEPVAPSSELRKEYVDQLLSNSEDTAGIQQALSLLDTTGSPTRRPVIGELLVADDGSIAVVRSDLDPSPWTDRDSIAIDLLANDGTYRGRVVVPPNVVIHQYTGTHLYAVEKVTVDRGGGLGTRTIQFLVRYVVGPRKG